MIPHPGFKLVASTPFARIVVRGIGFLYFGDQKLCFKPNPAWAMGRGISS
ncbi:hypothetical protein KKD84_03795 [Patescibacteria group bacterium]|nr:hypothetical protein [Patescibacteria group bacterium]